MERWCGKVAIVTGASSGIGAATAEALVKHGLQVLGLARRVERIEETAKKLAQEGPGKLHALKVDVMKENEILDAFKWTEDNLGPVSILINSAGCVKKAPLMSGETQKWKDILQTNVLGLSIATREAIISMKKGGIDGHIVHINSICGHSAQNDSGMYSPSKYAVTSLTEGLRRELLAAGEKIKITSLSPGLVATEIISPTNELYTEIVEQLPKLQPIDIVNGILYVLGTPPHVQVHELMIKPVGEPF